MPIAEKDSAMYVETGEIPVIRNSTALVISDHPILVAGVRTVLSHRYDVTCCTWSDFVGYPPLEADIVIADATQLSSSCALDLLRGTLLRARIVVCSLHRNEVEVCRLEHEQLIVEGALPSLLHLTA